MAVYVYIDSCAWNYLHQHCIDLAIELPLSEYRLCLTREVELELVAIPDIGNQETDKRPLKRYIQQNIGRSEVNTTCVFGFQTENPDGSPSKTQCYGGFGQGTFQSKPEREFYSMPSIQKQLLGKKLKKSGLSDNQADASLAVHATHAIILTNESPKKPGPLQVAKTMGGKVVYLEAEVEPSGLSLGQYLASIA